MSQTQSDNTIGVQSRGSIPEELLRPRRGEAPRYPIDIVIGELGRGSASVAAFNYANGIVTGLMSGSMEHSALASISAAIRESYLSALDEIKPESFRIGGGRAEPDGAISFLLRFIGRDKTITGELYIRYVTRQVQRSDGETVTTGFWRCEEILLEPPKDREAEHQEAIQRLEYFPYERFF